MKNYKLPEISKILEVNRNTLQSYVDRSLIFPTYPSTIRGEPHLFDLQAVVNAGVFFKLVKLGFTLELAKEVTYET